MFWWWERLDQRDVYPMYRPLAGFIQDVPWNGGQIEPASVTAQGDGLRCLGLQAGREVWLWLFNPAASWSNIVIEQHPPSEIQNAKIELSRLPAGDYQVEWFDTRSGRVIRKEQSSVADGNLRLIAPPFSHDLACRVK
jgi:hypothetical protein